MVTHLTVTVFLYQHPKLDYWPKHAGEHVINKNTS